MRDAQDNSDRPSNADRNGFDGASIPAGEPMPSRWAAVDAVELIEDRLKSELFRHYRDVYGQTVRLTGMVGARNTRRVLWLAGKLGFLKAATVKEGMELVRAVEAGMTLRDYLESDSPASWLAMTAHERGKEQGKQR
jgi:hypothetical protein